MSTWENGLWKGIKGMGMKNRDVLSKGKEKIRQKEWGSIIDDLFHQIASSMVSLEGYTATLSSEYAMKLDRRGRHYIRRIQDNMREMDRVIRILREYVNSGEKK